MSRYAMAGFASLLIIFLGSSGAQATLISADLFSLGDGKLTLDPNSGLEWLDITETFGLSKNDIDNGAGPDGGWSSGLDFRHATIFEVEQLYINHGFPDIDALTEANVAFFLTFFDLFGGICGSPSLRCDILGITGTIDEGDSLPDRLFFAAVRNFPEDSVAIAQLNGINNTADFSDAGWGNWLVRETIPIPEPSTFALFAIGLVGLGVMTRRRRRNCNISRPLACVVPQ